MLCPRCLKAICERDLVGDMCYKCVFELKKNTYTGIRICRLCKAALPKKRWVYCCEECAKIGAKKQSDQFWTKNLDYMKVSFKINYSRKELKSELPSVE